MAEFHFIRPWWLLAIIPIIAVTLWLWRRRHQQSWAPILPAHLRAVLLPASQQHHQGWSNLLVGLALLVSTLALAGPTWERLPQPVYQARTGAVIVMDMSLSMYSTDLTPNRLGQMRFKATDLATQHLDGDIGLVAYAGDAFVISPLTSDGQNLTNLIRALSPEIMPTPGSYPVRALELAAQLLADAGYLQGDIYWFTDGIDGRDQLDISQFLNRTPYRLNVLAIGTTAGAPIQLPDGRLLRDSSGQIVIPALAPGALPRLASHSGGRYSVIRPDQQDLAYLTGARQLADEGTETNLHGGDQWLDRGPWLLPLVLLLLLPLARRGVLFSLAPLGLLSVLLAPSPTLAQEAQQTEPLRWYQQLWRTPYQQADVAIAAGDYDQAAAIAQDAWQRGTANYRAGRYDQAFVDFSQVNSAEGFYNQGNALMQLERYADAVLAYQAALNRRPNWPEAEENLALAQQLAEQQQEQAQNQQQQSGEQQAGAGGTPNPDGEGDNQSSDNDTEQQPSEQSPETDTDESAAADDHATEADDSAAAPPAEGEQQLDSMTDPATDPASEELQQQMQQWLNRIEDDPAILLRNKMRYEAQQRRRSATPPGVDKSW